MVRNFTFTIDEDIYEKFSLAIKLANDTEDDAIEMSIKWYISKSFEKISHDYNPKSTAKKITKISKDYYGKASQRIPNWALKPNQYNHKIIRAYFMASEITNEVTITMIEQMCSDIDRKDLYVPTFKNNYSQMKLDTEKSHGKVFEDDGKNVWLWSEVKSILMKYKAEFYKGGE